MAYISLYRKYRSQDFRSIVGQEHIVRTLENAINNQRIAHAYIFAGPRGTGKTSMARILAKALNCREGVTVQPCLKCDLCESIKNGISMDVIEIDAASNRGIDEIRQLREQVNFMPSQGKYKIYIIDEVHMLTNEAFNALLKTLEEPPEFTVFILATTEVQKIPATIISRCQRLDFRRISVQDIVEHLQMIATRESVKIDEKSLNFIARINDGCMRDAISLLDQLISFKGKEIGFDDVLDLLGTSDFNALANLAELLAEKKLEELLNCASQLIADGKNILQFNKDLVEYLRNLMFVKIGVVNAVDISSENLEKLTKQSALFSMIELKRILLLFSKADVDMRWQQNMKLIFELAILEVCSQSVVVTESIEKTQAAATVSPVQQKEQLNEEIKKIKPVEKEVVSEISFKNDARGQWPEVLNRIKLIKPQLLILLSESDPLEIDGDNFLIKFKNNYSFHRDKLMQPENKEIVEKVLNEVFGRQLAVNPILENELPATNNHDQSQVNNENNLDEHTENVVDIFKGEIVKA